MEDVAREGLTIRWAIVTPLLWALVIAWSHLYEVAKDTRVFRDLAGTIPFTSVELTELTATEQGVQIEGTLLKTRGECLFTDLRGYMADNTEVEHEVHLDTSAEKFTGSRPAMPYPQSWGPWTLKFPDLAGFTAVSWCVFVAHQCPEDRQTNEFLCGKVPRVHQPR